MKNVWLALKRSTFFRKRNSIVAFLFCAVVLNAQDFSASVDNNTVALGEQIQLQFVLNNGGMNGGKNFKLPDVSKFMVLSGPNQSSSMQIINSAVSSTVTYSYVLQPREVGKFTIGSATIEANGKQFRSNPIDITVTKSSGKPKQQTAGNQQADTKVDVGENLFLRAVVDKARAYQGEQITVTYKIYTRLSIANYSINKLPTMTGFWSEELQVPQQVNLTNEVVNGKQYKVGVLKKIALFPTQSGTLEINPLEIICQVQIQSHRRSNDVFDQFFNDPFFGGVQTQNVGVKNAPVKITVLPLPKDGVPASFNGAVGKFSLSASLSKRNVKTNEPVSLKATISGTGNIKVLEAPALTLSNDFEKYDPKLNESIERIGGVINGSKSFEWLIVPRYPGEKKIPAMEFSYFDIGKGRYVTLRTNEYNLAVEKGSAEAPQVTSGLSKEDVKLLNQDIRFIKTTSEDFNLQSENAVSTTTVLVGTLLPLFACIGLLVYRRKALQESADVVTFRSRKAMKIATKRLKDAHSLLASNHAGGVAEAFYAEISRALWSYVSDKLAIDRAELSVDNVTMKLTEKNITAELVTQIKECLEACEFARFAPASSSHEEKQKMYDAAGNIIVSAERELQ